MKLLSTLFLFILLSMSSISYAEKEGNHDTSVTITIDHSKGNILSFDSSYDLSHAMDERNHLFYNGETKIPEIIADLSVSVFNDHVRDGFILIKCEISILKSIKTFIKNDKYGKYGEFSIKLLYNTW